MVTTDKFCLKWNEFKENSSNAFISLGKDRDFTDVILACEDNKQVEVHKVILAASSPVFDRMLRKNKHNHTLIYMRGIIYDDLVALVDFIYNGETNIFQENLESFLSIAEDLGLKGLAEDKSELDRDSGQKPPPMWTGL